MKRWTSILLSLVVVLLLLPAAVFARPVVTAYQLICTGLPEGTEYVDLLIELPKTDPNYAELVESNLPESFSVDAQNITYCEEEYRSYTFHYRDAQSGIAVKEEDGIWFFRNGNNGNSSHISDIQSRGDIKLAMLDAQGKIIKVSKPQSLKPKGLFVEPTPELHYDAETDTLEVGRDAELF